MELYKEIRKIPPQIFFGRQFFLVSKKIWANLVDFFSWPKKKNDQKKILPKKKICPKKKSGQKKKMTGKKFCPKKKSGQKKKMTGKKYCPKKKSGQKKKTVKKKKRP